jgi:fluoroacetyl-CoA thioesterase
VNAQEKEISFEEVCTVDANQTARRLFARLAHGHAYAGQLVEGLATGYLIAIVESICIREMLREMNLTTEVIVGAAVNIQHRAPVPPGKRVWLRGRTTDLGARKATFAVQAFDDDEVVCEGVMTFVATSRERIETRLARKLSAESRAPGGASKRQQRSVGAHLEAGFTRIAKAAMTPCDPLAWTIL